MQVWIGKEYLRQSKPSVENSRRRTRSQRCEAAVERLRENPESPGLHLERGWGTRPRITGRSALLGEYAS